MNQARKFTVGELVETQVRGWTVGKSKERQTPYVRITFNKYIDWTGWLTPKAMGVTMKTLKLLGYKDPTMAGIVKDDALDKDLFVFAEIEESREYNGNTYYKAKWINSPDSAAGFRDKDVTKDLLDEMKGIDTRAYISPTTDNSSSSNSESASYADSDIPF